MRTQADPGAVVRTDTPALRPLKPLPGRTLADYVIFLGMAVNAVVILLILYFYVF